MKRQDAACDGASQLTEGLDKNLPALTLAPGRRRRQVRKAKCRVPHQQVYSPLKDCRGYLFPSHLIDARTGDLHECRL